ncbi:MAG TPA: hypothetical protein VGE77_02590 [Nocardioides sp.]
MTGDLATSGFNGVLTLPYGVLPTQLDVTATLDGRTVGPVVFPAPRPYPDPIPVVMPTGGAARSAPSTGPVADAIERLRRAR